MLTVAIKSAAADDGELVPRAGNLKLNLLVVLVLVRVVLVSDRLLGLEQLARGVGGSRNLVGRVLVAGAGSREDRASGGGEGGAGEEGGDGELHICDGSWD